MHTFMQLASQTTHSQLILAAFAKLFYIANGVTNVAQALYLHLFLFN
jgi:hypothetical protein